MARDRRSIRLSNYDYRSAGAYFVTICTYGRECILEDANVHEWVCAAWHRAVCGGVDQPEYEFVVMPNHVHGIVWLANEVPDRAAVGAKHPRDQMTFDNTRRNGPEMPFGDKGASPLRDPVRRELLSPESGSLGAVVRAFKSAATKRVNTLRETPGSPVWQRGFYERIVRDEDELMRVREYIRDNPAKWAEDPNHPANIDAAPASAHLSRA